MGDARTHTEAQRTARTPPAPLAGRACTTQGLCDSSGSARDRCWRDRCFASSDEIDEKLLSHSPSQSSSGLVPVFSAPFSSSRRREHSRKRFRERFPGIFLEDLFFLLLLVYLRWCQCAPVPCPVLCEGVCCKILLLLAPDISCCAESFLLCCAEISWGESARKRSYGVVPHSSA